MRKVIVARRYSDVRAAFNGALRRAGIKDFHFRDLRHTFASHLVLFAGAPHLKEFEPRPRSQSTWT
jgi:integrase